METNGINPTPTERQRMDEPTQRTTASVFPTSALAVEITRLTSLGLLRVISQETPDIIAETACLVDREFGRFTGIVRS